MRRGAQKGGFTLLEMLVAMTIMSVLAASLYASLTTAFRGRQVTEDSLEPVLRASAAMSILGDDLAEALPPTGLLAAEFVATDATGEGGEPADELVFHALSRDVSGSETPSPVRKVEFILTEGTQEDEMVLVRRTTLNLLSPETVEPVEEVLCRNVRSLGLSFYDGTTWQESWDSTTAGQVLPLAVNVTLVLDVKGRTGGYTMARATALPCGEVVQDETSEPARTGGGQ